MKEKKLEVELLFTLTFPFQKEDGDNRKGRLSLHAEVYHAGLTAGRRNQVQKSFMSGNNTCIMYV